MSQCWTAAFDSFSKIILKMKKIAMGATIGQCLLGCKTAYNNTDNNNNIFYNNGMHNTK